MIGAETHDALVHVSRLNHLPSSGRELHVYGTIRCRSRPNLASGDQSSPNETEDVPSQPPENLFDPREVSVGDSIVGLTLRTSLTLENMVGWKATSLSHREVQR